MSEGRDLICRYNIDSKLFLTSRLNLIGRCVYSCYFQLLFQLAMTFGLWKTWATCPYSEYLYRQQRTSPIVENQAVNDEKSCVSQSIISQKSSPFGKQALNKTNRVPSMFRQSTISTIDNSTTGNKLEIEHPSNLTNLYFHGAKKILHFQTTPVFSLAVKTYLSGCTQFLIVTDGHSSSTRKLERTFTL